MEWRFVAMNYIAFPWRHALWVCSLCALAGLGPVQAGALQPPEGGLAPLRALLEQIEAEIEALGREPAHCVDADPPCQVRAQRLRALLEQRQQLHLELQQAQDQARNPLIRY